MVLLLSGLEGLREHAGYNFGRGAAESPLYKQLLASALHAAGTAYDAAWFS